MKLPFAWALCAVILCLSSCANNEKYPSIVSISVSWLELKSVILNTEQTSDIASRIENFRLTLNRFLSSPIIYLYRVRSPENIQILANMDSAADRLNAALKDGQTLLPIIQEIDSYLEQLWLIEKSLSDASQLQIFQFLLETSKNPSRRKGNMIQ